MMKFASFLLVVFIGFVTAISDEEVLQKWKNYQVEFEKSYRSPLEERKRLQIFKQNLYEIENHNSLYEEGKTSYTAGINKFTDWTEEEFMEYVNRGLKTRPVISGSIHNRTGHVADTKSIDWRKSGVVTPVKDQGHCGSCWSFSATGALEGQLGRKGHLVSLSEQNLIDCAEGDGCGGGLMDLAFEYVKNGGIESEEDYPYTASTGTCHADPLKMVTKISSYHDIARGNEDDLQDAIATVGPISVAIYASSNLKKYSGGIFTDDTCNSVLLNHGVLAVGYGSENGINYYIVKNSWGASWGEEGYFRIERNNNLCGIATKASYPLI